MMWCLLCVHNLSNEQMLLAVCFTKIVNLKTSRILPLAYTYTIIEPSTTDIIEAQRKVKQIDELRRKKVNEIKRKTNLVDVVVIVFVIFDLAQSSTFAVLERRRESFLSVN